MRQCIVPHEFDPVLEILVLPQTSVVSGRGMDGLRTRQVIMGVRGRSPWRLCTENASFISKSRLAHPKCWASSAPKNRYGKIRSENASDERRPAIKAHGTAGRDLEAVGAVPNVDDTEGTASEDQWFGRGSHGWFEHLRKRLGRG
jgi:hypothetical protein